MTEPTNSPMQSKLSDVHIEVKRISPGARFAYDLYDDHGNVVLAAHTSISEGLINHLVNRGTENLYYVPGRDEVQPRNDAGLDLSKKVVDDSLQEEAIVRSKEVLDTVRNLFDRSPDRVLGKEKVESSRRLLNTILDDIDKNENGIFVPLNKLKSMDEYTYVHSSNVAVLGAILGSRLQYQKEVRISMGIGGLFHDIGKSSIAEDILNKKGKLLDEEFDIIKEHPHIGYTLTEKNPHINELEKRIILLHHERADGNGYPFGLDQSHITRKVPKEVRMLSICDVFSALITTTPYRDAYTPAQALRMLLNLIYAPFKKQFFFLAPDLRDFIRAMGFLLNQGAFFFNQGDMIRLSSGEVALVEEMNKLYPLNPRISLMTNNELKPLKRPIGIDMIRDFTNYVAYIFDKNTKDYKLASNQ